MSEIKEDLKEHWQIECLESLFGSEDLFDVRHDDPTGNGDFKEVPCEIVVRRKFAVDSTKAREQKLLEVISVLKEACGFYGDKDNWIDYILKGEDHIEIKTPRYAGNKARQALAKVDEMLREIGVGNE